MNNIPKSRWYEQFEQEFLKQWPQAPHTAIEMMRMGIVQAEDQPMSEMLNQPTVQQQIERIASEKAEQGAALLIREARQRYLWLEKTSVDFVDAAVRACDKETRTRIARLIERVQGDRD